MSSTHGLESSNARKHNENQSMLKRTNPPNLPITDNDETFLAAQSLHLKLPGRPKSVLGFFAGMRLTSD